MALLRKCCLVNLASCLFLIVVFGAVFCAESQTYPSTAQNAGPAAQIGPGGTLNPRTGEVYPSVPGGALNPRTGEVYPRAGSGYISPRPGEPGPESAPGPSPQPSPPVLPSTPQTQGSGGK
jgi:hypothetical protein